MSAKIDDFLRNTLEDHRLSRSEKRGLDALTEELGSDEHTLAVYRSRAFEIARQNIAGAEPQAVLLWLEEVIKRLQPKTQRETPDAEALFSPADDCPRRIGNLLRAAQQTADICVFTITDDRISDAMLEAHRRGVKLRVITDNEKVTDAGSDIFRLDDAGVPVRMDRTEYHMHHKFALFDQRALVTGSYNWTRGAANYNAENMVICYDSRLIARFQRQFDHLWDEFG